MKIRGDQRSVGPDEFVKVIGRVLRVGRKDASLEAQMVVGATAFTFGIILMRLMGMMRMWNAVSASFELRFWLLTQVVQRVVVQKAGVAGFCRRREEF